MHAILIVTKMDPTKTARQRRELEEVIVPMVKGLPGFVSATWLQEAGGGRAGSIVVLDSEEGARRLAAMIEADLASPRGAEAGVALDASLIGEVQAHV
jgi:hypothetical protein